MITTVAIAPGRTVTFFTLRETERTIGRRFETFSTDSSFEISFDSIESEASESSETRDLDFPDLINEFGTLGKAVIRLVLGKTVGRLAGRDVAGTLAVAKILETCP